MDLINDSGVNCTVQWSTNQYILLPYRSPTVPFLPAPSSLSSSRRGSMSSEGYTPPFTSRAPPFPEAKMRYGGITVGLGYGSNVIRVWLNASTFPEAKKHGRAMIDK